MGLYVQKYGGSSVADAACMRRVAQRIRDTQAAGNPVLRSVQYVWEGKKAILRL